MIITNVEGIKDPFILLDNGIYYLCCKGVGEYWEDTVWACFVNDGGSLKGEWKKTENKVYENPSFAQKQSWAPEVHKYKGAYYMFASYYSSKTNHRGTSIPLYSFPQCSLRGV